ncbi:flagellar hook-associated protein FlgK [Clostridium malenominatum]|uniref:Flagellar hook-associated protein 1 n=1 Tax=Clostridium malenominatum TaxID=1539 RepID=A0ABP3U523_9CLOT
MSGLFGTLNIGKSGLFANQRAIDVATHNIANANTEGYSRQRAEMQTRRPFCTPGMNNAAEPGQIGTGVIISQITRVRDSFLDYQVRVELGVQGNFAGRDKFLREVENIFNEPSDTGISNLIGKFFDSWQQLAKQGDTSNARTVVAEQSKALADELNRVYDKLEKLKGNAQDVIRQSVFDANSIMRQIRQLNDEIIQVSVAGNNPNDLMDRRDYLLDQLSGKFGVKIDKVGHNAIDVNTKEDAKALPPGGGNLIQGINPENVLNFAYISSIEPSEGVTYGQDGTYKVTYYKNGDMTSEKNKVVIEMSVEGEDNLTAMDKLRALDECRVIWTGKDGLAVDKEGKPLGESANINSIATFTPSSGELKGYMSVQEDIDANIEQLNKLAQAIVYSVNAIHSQNGDASLDDLPFFVNKDKANYSKNPSKLTNLEDVLGAESNITAGNISINVEILNNVMLIKTGKDLNGGESDGKRALAIASLRDKFMEIQNIKLEGAGKTNRKSYIDGLCGGLVKDNDLDLLVVKGSTDGMKIDSYFKDSIDRLGVQAQEAKRMVKNQQSVLAGFEESRLAVSGVALDEEMTNMIQFQHAYQANAKIISTVDELLDVIVNGLKR